MSITCTVTSNLTNTCADDAANAGMQDLYMVFSDQVDTVTVGVSNAHTITAVSTVGAAKFIRMKARFETKNIETTMDRTNWNKRSERVLNAFIPNLSATHAELLNDYSNGKKLFVIAALNNYSSTDVREAIVPGYCNNLKEESGMMLTVNETIEDSVGGVIGYNVTFTGIATELMRKYIGTITVEDAATGETVTLGS